MAAGVLRLCHPRRRRACYSFAATDKKYWQETPQRKSVIRSHSLSHNNHHISKSINFTTQQSLIQFTTHSPTKIQQFRSDFVQITGKNQKKSERTMLAKRASVARPPTTALWPFAVAGSRTLARAPRSPAPCHRSQSGHLRPRREEIRIEKERNKEDWRRRDCHVVGGGEKS